MTAPRITSPIGRSIKEWIGRDPDEAVPEFVRLRIWRRQDGICGLTGRKIMPGDRKELHHIKGLAERGEHRESNLIWVLSDAHKDETAEQAGRRAKADAAAKKHIGARTVPVRKIANRGFAKSEKAARRVEKPKLAMPSEIQRRFMTKENEK